MKPQRNVNADILRLIAAFFVPAVHFMLNNGFYYVPIAGAEMTVMVVMRSFFIVCVPLFLLLTGYLMKNKQLSKSYYKGIVHTLVIYLLSSVLCGVYILLFVGGKTPLELALGIFGFTTAPYGWYVEMYIGLFLLIPFLNLIYNNLPSDRARKILIGTLILLTSLPAILNVYRFDTLEWWIVPSQNAAFQPLLPKFWAGLYPLTYYYIGAYLRDHEPRLKQFQRIILIVSVVTVSSAYNLWRSVPGVFVWGAWNDWASPFNLALSVLVFSFVMRLPTEKAPDKLRKALSFLSSLTLGAYLTSFIFDHFYYYLLLLKEPTVPGKLKYFPLIVPAVFLSAMLLSALLELPYRGVSALWRRRKTGKPGDTDPVPVQE